LNSFEFRSSHPKSKAEYSNWNANTPFDAAIAYAASGLAVFPAPPGYKMSYKSARFNGGERWGATKDPLEIERDWARFPQASVCIVTGAVSGLFVVETDTAAHGVDGAAALREVIYVFGSGDWPETRKRCRPPVPVTITFNGPITG
jgi:hypothetical protein